MALRASTAEIERVFTADEFEQMTEFEERFELIAGKVVKKTVPGFEHANIANLIKEHYTLFDPQRKLGTMLMDASTNIGPNDTPLPDLSYWQAANRPTPTAKAASRPDLVVEVLSPRDVASRKRREEVQTKIWRYQAAGVRLIWLINPKAQEIEVYQPGRLDPVQVLKAPDDRLDGGDIIPGFSLKLAELFQP